MTTRHDLQDLSLDELADALSEKTPQSVAWGIVMAEFQRRAALTAEDVATATKDSAKWMLASVVAITITSGAQAVFAFLTWHHSNSP
jgi:hypothetical protein